MAQVAKTPQRDLHLHKQCEQCNRIALEVDEDVHKRIRALFNSRNDHRPPTAPFPSPDLLNYSQLGNRMGYPGGNDSSTGPRRLTMPEQKSHCWMSKSDMMAPNLDGADYLPTPLHSRLPRRASRSDNLGLKVSADEFEPNSHKTQDKSSNHDLGHFLRVVPPKRTLTAQLDVRPEAIHMPGSYISITSNKDTVAPSASVNSHHEDHTGHQHEQLDLHDSVGMSAKSEARASDSLKQLKADSKNASVPAMNREAEPRQNLGTPILEEERDHVTDPMDKVASPFETQGTISNDASDVYKHQSNAAMSEPLKSVAPIIDSQMKSDHAASPTPLARDLSVLSNLSNQSHARSASRASIGTSHQKSSSLSLKLVSISPVESSSSDPPAPSDPHESAHRGPMTHWAERGKYTTAALPETLTQKSTQEGDRNVTQKTSRSRTGPLRQFDVASSRTSEPNLLDEDISFKENGRGQAFTRAISNLENLLEEALDLADRSDVPITKSEEQLCRERRCTRPGKLKALKTDVEQWSDSLKASATDEVSLRRPSHKGQSGFKVEQNTMQPSQKSAPSGKTSSRHERVKSKLSVKDPVEVEPLPFKAKDWAYVRQPLGPESSSPTPEEPRAARHAIKEQKHHVDRPRTIEKQQRASHGLRQASIAQLQRQRETERTKPYLLEQFSPHTDSDEPFSGIDVQHNVTYHDRGNGRRAGNHDVELSTFAEPPARRRTDTVSPWHEKETLSHSVPRENKGATAKEVDLSRRHHFSIRGHGFSLGRSHRHKPIARDWSNARKRFVAVVTCLTTALLGMVLGIYAGEVPAIQYTLADEHHYTILGNVVLFLGLAISTILFWPLPVLHGRKPYIMAALVILLPLQFPQAIAVNVLRSPNQSTYRTGVLLPRAISGFVMGFANINFMTTLLDLFGASLQSRNPHQEIVNEHDVRRHGGGIGIWLGIWTWCSVMSIGVGFLIGAGIISGLNVSWGFWIIIVINAGVLLLNVVMPEVRRSPYRRSMAEVRTGTEVSRRVARGEIKMHLDQTGPRVWYEELQAGYRLCFMMIKQPGFFVLALYQGWIYGQIVLIIALLGALLSKYYLFRPQYVGLGVLSIPLGGLLAVPFQKASLFSRSRKTRQRTDSMTFEKRVTWSSHLVRRAIFTITLPFAGLAYTLASDGSVHFIAPILFAGLIGFLSNLAIAECNGLIMETFDTSDLQPGMTGRPRKNLPDHLKRKRTNFSCFPRVTAGFTVAQTFAFLIAAATTAWAGVIERHLGAQVATAVMAGILLFLTLALLGVLWRHTTVQIIPSERFGTNVLSGPEDEWKPVIIGKPSGTTRRMSILELGRMSRWTEIRRRNRLGTW